MTYNSSKTGAQVDGAVTDVQAAKAAGATDTTAGRLLKVGDGGLLSDGSAARSRPTDCNIVPASGFYQVAGGASNRPAGAGASSGLLDVYSWEGNTNIKGQEFTQISAGTTSKWFRITVDGTFTDAGGWQELFHTGNTPITPNATNLILNSGAKLGIGTTSPPHSLTVDGSATVTGDSELTGTFTGVTIRYLDGLNSAYIQSVDVLDGVRQSSKALSIDASELVFRTIGTNFTERLRIDPDGNVIKGVSGPRWAHGTGSPEGVVTARVGSFYSRTDGGAGTSFYVKESGTGNTGWVAK